MKLKNTIVAGIFGAVGLLALTGSYASAYPTCKSGSIVTAGAGYVAPNGGFYAPVRYVTLTCDAGQLQDNDDPSWTGDARTFVVSTNSAYDQDGKYATILTLLAMGGTRKVSYYGFSFKTTSPDNAVTNNRVILSLGIL